MLGIRSRPVTGPIWATLSGSSWATLDMGDERAHAELGGERHSLLEMRSSRVGVSGIAAFLGLAEGAETLRLVAPLAASASVLKPALGNGPRLTWLAS